MSILRDFERRLEGVVEGAFAKTFRSEAQPVELAKRILREMESGRTVAPRGVWVPNRYVLKLSQVDFERFRAAEQPLARELRQVVRDGAKERGWGLVGPPEIVFEGSRSLKRGEFRCVASLAEGEDHGEEGTAAAEAQLVTVGGSGPAQPVALSKDVTSLGRLPECDVVVADPGASRRHAEIRRRGDGYALVDLASTNGTLVNGAAVAEVPLEPGDLITIGETVLEFRRI